MRTVIMGSEGKLTIPLELWERIGVWPGDTVELTLTDKGVLEFRPFRGDLNEIQGAMTRDVIPDSEEGGEAD